MEKVSLEPRRNLEMGFERTVIWGGRGHEPITLHTFLRSFSSMASVSTEEEFSRMDPGARFGSFDHAKLLTSTIHRFSLFAAQHRRGN